MNPPRSWLVVVAASLALAAALAGCSRFKEPPPVQMVNLGTFPGPYRILFGGDTSFGESYGKEVRDLLTQRGYEYPLAKLRPLMAASEFIALNLETPITDLKRSPFTGKKDYVHWTDVVQAPKQLVAHGVKLVTLGNNHTLDYGRDGLDQTIDILNINGIRWIGAGKTERQARDPYLGEVTVGGRPFQFAVLGGFEYSRVYDDKYDFYAKGRKGGAARLSDSAIARQIGELRAKYPGIYVIVFPHWGQNYSWKVDRQADAAHAWIDAGADLIVGHGGHVMQEIERYNGRLILYGIGNFMFNSEGRFRKADTPPFGLPVQLILAAGPEGLTKTIRGYPIFSDNRLTEYQPRLVAPEEFDRAFQSLRDRSGDTARFDAEVRRGEDAIGKYLEVTP